MGKKQQGVLANRYQMIPRVLIFPFDSEGKVLLLKGDENKRIWPGLWNGIGGHVELGEHILDAAKRELAEETGLSAGRWLFCGQVMVDTQSLIGIAFFIFKALDCSGIVRESIEGKLGWFEPDKAHLLDMVEDLYYLIPRVVSFHQGNIPFWGLYQYDENDQLIMRFAN